MCPSPCTHGLQHTIPMQFTDCLHLSHKYHFRLNAHLLFYTIFSSDSDNLYFNS